jgi:HEAT repeat protein
MIHYCPHCWQEVPSGPEHCPHCGQLVDDSGQPFVERMLSTLHHPEPTRAGLAVDVLGGRLHEARAVQPLIELLGRAVDAALLMQAARGLGELGDQRAVPGLAHLLADGGRPFVARRAAALALGRLGGAEAIHALEAALGDPRPSVAEAAREALLQLVTSGTSDEGCP